MERSGWWILRSLIWSIQIPILVPSRSRIGSRFFDPVREGFLSLPLCSRNPEYSLFPLLRPNLPFLFDGSPPLQSSACHPSNRGVARAIASQATQRRDPFGPWAMLAKNRPIGIGCEVIFLKSQGFSLSICHCLFPALSSSLLRHYLSPPLSSYLFLPFLPHPLSFSIFRVILSICVAHFLIPATCLHQAFSLFQAVLPPFFLVSGHLYLPLSLVPPLVSLSRNRIGPANSSLSTGVDQEINF